MDRIDINAMAEAILNAPGWARVGITAPSPSLHLDAAIELAKAIAQTSPPLPQEDDQIRLAL
jgi:hypothetical protein